jgi:hypothetical protein
VHGNLKGGQTIEALRSRSPKYAAKREVFMSWPRVTPRFTGQVACWAMALVFAFPISVIAATQDFEFTLRDYEIVSTADGRERIVVEGFAPAHAGGLPALPGRTFRIQLPRGAEVLNLEILDAVERPITGAHRIELVRPQVLDRAVPPEERAALITSAVNDAADRAREAENTDEPFPSSPVSLVSVTRSVDGNAAHVRFEPFRYKAQTGELSVFVRVTGRLHYRLQLAADPLSEGTTIDLSALPSPVQPVLPPGRFDYVIVLPDSTLAPVFADFVKWKEQIGHRVIIINLAAIGAGQPDRARRLRSVLASQLLKWGVRYVLLVGDLDVMPGRLFYPDQTTTRPFLDDFYFSNLRQSTWDGDGDNRWGEFAGEYDTRPDVAVGRLPFSDQTTLKNILTRTVAFEKETGARKRAALLASGVYDLSPTDAAVTSKKIMDDLLLAGVWNVTTLYQPEGTKKTRPSSLVPDHDLSDSQYWSSLAAVTPALVIATAHGHPSEMTSYRCIRPSGDCNKDSKAPADLDTNKFSIHKNLPAATPSSIVYLNGCSTARPVSDMEQWNTPLLSLLDPGTTFGATDDNNARRYLERGAVAVIASTAGMTYTSGWSDVGSGGGQTLSYLFLQALVRDGRTLGEALASAQEEHATRFGLKRGIRVLQLFGDPSLVFDGVSVLEPHKTSIVYNGAYDHFAGDYDSGGDLYTAIVKNGSGGQPTRLHIMLSRDHGKTWEEFNSAEFHDQVRSLKVKVNRLRPGEFSTSFLHVFLNTSKGTSTVLWDFRFALDRPLTDRHKIGSFPTYPGGQDKLETAFSVGRTPDAGDRTLVIAYSFKSGGQDRIRVGRSIDNGATWRDWAEYKDFLAPAVDLDARNNVFMAACRPGKARRIAVTRSLDGGAHWQAWRDLPQPSNALEVCGSQGIALAASSDPGRPAVWVAFSVNRGAGGMVDTDIDLAISPDSGATWTADRALARNMAGERFVDLQSYKPQPSRWINAAYLTSPFGAWSDVQPSARIHWRWSSGSTPDRWSSSRLLGAGPIAKAPPQVLFAPAAPHTGSGVLYGKSNQVLFSAPWL